MKVGVYVKDLSPQLGGGFTFQDEVFRAFIRLISESQHTFVVISEGRTLPVNDGSIEFFSLPRGLLSRVLFRFGRILEAVYRRATKRDSFLHVEGALEKLLRQQGVQFVWYIGPYGVTMEVPYLFTVWDLQHRMNPFFPEVSQKGLWAQREYGYLTRLQRAAGVITCTDVVKTQIERFYQVPSERIWVLPFPSIKYDFSSGSELACAVRQKYGLPEQFLFYPAQFWPHKNHINLLDALRILREETGLTMPLVLTGSDKGNAAYVCEYISKLGMEKQVFILDFVPRDDLIGLFCAAFSLITPTLFGPGNLPALEAFSLGCPVATSDVPGAREQFGDAALYFNPRSPEDIARSIKELVDSPVLRKQLVERGKEISTRWTVDDYVRGVFAILDEFASVRRCWQ